MRKDYFGQASAPSDLNRRSLRGGALSLVSQATNIVVQVVSTIVFARLLAPEHFGMVAMVIAVTGFASVFIDLGTRDAVAQRGTVTEGEVSALFWLTLGVGLACAGVTVLAAPFIARFYDEPRLAPVAMVLSLTFVLPALYYQQYALMRRALQFGTLAVIDIASNVLATAIAIVLAWRGYGYWVLVLKPILTLLFSAIGVWLCCEWRPARPTFTSGVKELLKFGLNVIGFSMIDYVARSADRVALGYTTSARQLGYYQNAAVIYENPIALVMSLHNVAVSAMSRLRGDLVELKRTWSIALSSLTFFGAPAFAVLATIGQDLIVLLLGSKWGEAGAILSILALRGPAHLVERTLGWLHVASGQPDRWRRWGIVNCAGTLAALFCGLPFGATGVAAAYAVFSYVLFIPAIAYSGQPFGIGAKDVVKATAPQVLAALAVAGLGFGLKYTLLAETGPIVRMVVLAPVCAGVYLAVMVLGFGMTRPLTIAASLLRRRRHPPADQGESTGS